MRLLLVTVANRPAALTRWLAILTAMLAWQIGLFGAPAQAVPAPDPSQATLAVRTDAGRLAVRVAGSSSWTDLGGELLEGTDPVVVDDGVRHRYLAIFGSGQLFQRTDDSDWAALAPATVRCLGIGADVSADGRSVVVACTEQATKRIVSMAFPVGAAEPFVSTVRPLGQRSNFAPEVVTMRRSLVPGVPAGTTIMITGSSYPIDEFAPPRTANLWVRTLNSPWVKSVTNEGRSDPRSIPLLCAGPPRADAFDAWGMIGCRSGTTQGVDVMVMNTALGRLDVYRADALSYHVPEPESGITPVSIDVALDRGVTTTVPVNSLATRPTFRVVATSGARTWSWQSVNQDTAPPGEASGRWSPVDGPPSTAVALESRSTFVPGAIPLPSWSWIVDSAGRFWVLPSADGKISLWDRLAGRTRTFGPVIDGQIEEMTISGNGRYLAFTTSGAVNDVYLLDIHAWLRGPSTVRAVTSGADGANSYLRLSHDGSVLRFVSTATNLTSGEVGAGPHRYVYTAKTNQTRLDTALPLAQAATHFSVSGRWAVYLTEQNSRWRVVDLSSGAATDFPILTGRVYGISDNGDVLYSEGHFGDDGLTYGVSLLRHNEELPIDISINGGGTMSADGRRVAFTEWYGQRYPTSSAFLYDNGVISSIDNRLPVSSALLITPDGKWVGVHSQSELAPGGSPSDTYLIPLP